MAETWSIVESPFRTQTARAYEGLLTQGSGYLHVRASLEERLRDLPHGAAGTSKWGAYVPGVFGRHPALNDEMINLPFFLGLAPRVAGESLDMEASEVADYRRELSLRQALLRRTLTWRTRAGAVLSLTFERFVSAARKNLCVQRMTLVSDRDVEVEVRAGIDADIRTNGHDHYAAVAMARCGRGGVSCEVTTDAQDRVRIVSELRGSAVEWEYEQEARLGMLRGTAKLSAGQAIVIEKRTVVTTSRDLVPSDAAELLREAGATSWQALLDEHVVAWATRWDACDVTIEGDDRSQLAMRASLYHLLRCHVPGDNRVAVDAKGYAGEAYYGRFFWDTEMYILPFYVYTDPARARTLVDFRVQSLPGALRNAASYRYPGARYAWESAGEGTEQCHLWQIRDNQIHVTADVVYGMAHYAKAADAGYLSEPRVREVLLETGRYWLARLDRREGEDALSLLGVMGPDEFTLSSSNNSYTNRMVKFSLLLSAQAAMEQGLADQAAELRDAAGRLNILVRPDGLVLQSEEFERQAALDFGKLWPDRSKPFQANVPLDLVYRGKCIKQADVLMLMHPHPGEFTDSQVRLAYEHYLPYTTHDSSLSASIHTIIALRLGMDEEAWRFWRASCEVDLDVRRGGAAEGIHIAAAGANWQVAVMGFAGVSSAMQADVLTLRPRLPKAWTRLAFPLVWKGAPLRVEIAPDGTTVTNRGAAALPVKVGNAEASIAPGSSAMFKP